MRLVLKLSPIQEPPHLSFAIGHDSREKVEDALRRCRTSDSTHPRIVQLEANSLAEQRRKAGTINDSEDLFSGPRKTVSPSREVISQIELVPCKI